ncbi:hypothetical protein GQ44DRAFT_97208 [Phaeosphaeriaceae sp. PMI808]|nr:hypothetical protein GQ44DRAFT_97208 [Phaeosphaeriaceae sp. PMI808]
MDMLLACALFRPIQSGTGNYYQLSGIPISDLNPDQNREDLPNLDELNPTVKGNPLSQCNESKSPSAITFVRSRILYAEAALNAKGGVRFGMRHIHVLNRFAKRDSQTESIHILRYIFPRQFGLHNVFTSKVDARETAMPFKDYTQREKEIHQCMCKALEGKVTDVEEVHRWKSRIPKRLRGTVITLVNRLRTLNYRCPYTELLRHIHGQSSNTTPQYYPVV